MNQNQLVTKDPTGVGTTVSGFFDMMQLRVFLLNRVTVYSMFISPQPVVALFYTLG